MTLHGSNSDPARQVASRRPHCLAAPSIDARLPFVDEEHRVRRHRPRRTSPCFLKRDQSRRVGSGAAILPLHVPNLVVRLGRLLPDLAAAPGSARVRPLAERDLSRVCNTVDSDVNKSPGKFHQNFPGNFLASETNAGVDVGSPVSPDPCRGVWKMTISRPWHYMDRRKLGLSLLQVRCAGEGRRCGGRVEAGGESKKRC